MRDHDDIPTIVIERDTGGGLGSFVLGALVGAGVALLFAPRSGEETQAEIRERAQRLRDAAEGRVRDVQKQLEDRIEDARTEMEERVDQMKEAVESGRRAAQDARSELEGKLERSKAAYRAGIDAAREASKADAEGGEESDD